MTLPNSRSVRGINKSQSKLELRKKSSQPLFTDEFDEDQFEFEQVPVKLDGSEDEDDSKMSGAFSRLSRKSHLELLL
jgi:hypothetical protein